MSRYDETPYGENTGPHQSGNFIAIKPPAGVGVRVYNDDTSDAVFERLTIAANGTGYDIKSEASATKTARSVTVTVGGITLAVSTAGVAVVGGAVTLPQVILSGLNTAPATASSSGTKGDIRITADSIYLCSATDTWVKAALVTWP